MKLLTLLISANLLHGGVVELLGPGLRQVSRNQQAERGDGTGQFLELAIFPSPGVSGFSKVQLWTSKREAGKYTRVKLNEKELQIPDPQRIARELYDFPFPNIVTANSASAENRVAILCGTADYTMRVLNTVALTVGKSIPLPALARNIALRPGASEAWVSHSGALSQISITDLAAERVAASISLRLNQTAIPVALFFSNSGRTAYVVLRNPDALTDRGQVLVIDAATRAVRSTVSLGSGLPLSAVISPDGQTIYIGGTSLNDLNTAESSITYFDTATNSAGPTVGGLAVAPTELLIHPNGARLYWIVPQFVAIEEFDTQSRSVLRRINLPRPHTSQGLDISPLGDLILIRDSTGQQALHLNSETGETLDAQPIPAGPGAMLFRP